MSKFIVWGILAVLQCILLFSGSSGVIGWPWPFILSPALLVVGNVLPYLFYTKRFYRLGILVVLIVGQVVLFIVKFSAVEVLSWYTVLTPLWLSLYLAILNLPALLIALIGKMHGRV